MHFRISFVAFLMVFISCAVNKTEKDLNLLRNDINEELKTHKGTFAIAFKDLTTGEELLINEKVTFHAASTMKTPVLIEAYKQAQEGKFSLTDSVHVKNEFKSIVDGSTYSISDDSERDLYKLIGQKRPMSELLYKMIINSSNLATNLVIEYLDAKNVNNTMREYGAKDIKVLRGVEDIKAYDKGLNNTTTAHDLLIILTKIASGEAVSREASDEMINILLDQEFDEVIPAKLPQDVKVANKTGFITGVRHDSGIVILPDGRKYVLVLLSKGIVDDAAVISSMAEISLLVYQYVTSENTKLLE